jgi:hypothetical protein
MPTREETGPEGEIRLYYQCEESASSHRDITRRARLRVPVDLEKTVVLTLESSDSNAIKQTRDTNKMEFSIPIEKLIELIKEHGEEYHLRPFAKKKKAQSIA